MECLSGRGFLQELANLLEIQSTPKGGSVIGTNPANDEPPEKFGTLVTAILARWLHGNTSSLAALDGGDVVTTAHSFPSCEQFPLLMALGADKSIEQLFRIILINTDAGTMVPVLATAITIYHHTMIIRTTADTVFTAIIAFGIRSGVVHLRRRLAGALRDRGTGLFCCRES
jgi:hypothetical protein